MRKIENHKATFLENLFKASCVRARFYFFPPSFKIPSIIQECLIPGFFPYKYIDTHPHFIFNWDHYVYSAHLSYYIISIFSLLNI